MPTNRALRAALLGKMHWSKQTLSARVQKKKDATPMSTEEATYLLAFEHGIRIDRFLDSEQVARVRALHQQAGGGAHAAPAPPTGRRVPRGAPSEIRFPGEFKTTNPLLSSGRLKEAKEMAAIFPLLHVLENSIRELVKRVMHAKYGADWWDTELVAGRLKNVRDKAAGRMRSEEERHFWHQRRGAHPIDYVDLPDLGTIVNGKQADFIPTIIPDREWFAHMMRELEPSRNVVCHMNPLDSGNIDDVKGWFRKWERTLAQALARSAIPATAP
jgi:hypothetical protein